MVIARSGATLRPYRVNPDTGAAVAANIFAAPTSSVAVAFDAFSAGVRREDLVLVTESDVMSRFFTSPAESGSTANVTLIYDNSSSDGDPVDEHANVSPSIVALAASNSFPQAQTSVLYAIDSTQNTLVKVDWISGSMDTIAELGTESGADLEVPVRTGFDISGVTGLAYLAVGSGSATALRKVDLTTGDTVDFGRIGPALQQNDVTVVGISALPPSGLVNLSTRSRVGTGEDVMIAGFIATGSAPARFIIRGIGPSLNAAGVQGALADPVLTIFDHNGTEIASNDSWRSDQQAAIVATGVAPTNDLEAAYVGTFPPGA